MKYQDIIIFNNQKIQRFNNENIKTNISVAVHNIDNQYN